MIKEPPKKFYNSGIAILKIAACFGVVSLHMGNGGFGRKLAVPIFVLITFYLSGRVILTHNTTALLNRIKRLAIPYFSWGIIGFLCSMTFSWKKLISQLCFGRAIDIPAGHLYYLELCILLLVVLFVLVRGSGVKAVLFELNLFAVLSLILQYSGVNYLAFGWMHYNVANTLGRFFEFAPYACVGLQFALMSKEGVRLRRSWIVLNAVLSSVIYLVFHKVQIPGFSYQGLPLFYVTISWCAIACLIEKRCADGGLVMTLSSVTSGVYYMHMLVGEMLSHYMGLERSWTMTLVVWTISAIVSFFCLRFRALKWLVE